MEPGKKSQGWKRHFCLNPHSFFTILSLSPPWHSILGAIQKSQGGLLILDEIDKSSESMFNALKDTIENGGDVNFCKTNNHYQIKVV